MAYYGHQDDAVAGADLHRRYVTTMAKALVERARTGDRLLLVGGDRVDTAVAQDIRAAAHASAPDLSDRALQVRECSTFTDLTAEMSSAAVVIGSRFHNLICALRLGRPTVSVGYAGKCQDLMVAVGLSEFSQDIEELDADRLLAQVIAARRSGRALADGIRSTTSAYATEVDALLHQVSSEVLGLGGQAGTGRPAAEQDCLCRR